MNEWKLKKKKTLFKSEWQGVEEWFFLDPEDKEVSYTMAMQQDIVIVFGITKDKQVLLLKEFYPTTQKKVKTLVAGFIEDKTKEDAVAQELKEEAGCVAGELVYLGQTIRGKYETGIAYHYLALDIEKRFEQELEEKEDIDIEFISIEEFKELLRTSQIHDAFEVVCAYKAIDYLENN